MSAERERVSMNARVERALRDKARQTAEARGMALVDLIAAAVEAYCAEPSAPPAAAAVVAPMVAPQATPGELADLEEILRLVRTTVADVHMIREVLVQTRPRQELEAARETTRGWLAALRIARRADSRP